MSHDYYMSHKLIFKGSEDGFKTVDFRKVFAETYDHLFVIKSEMGKIFGAYIKTYSSFDQWQQGLDLHNDSFIFSLRNDLQFVKLKCKNLK